MKDTFLNKVAASFLFLLCFSVFGHESSNDSTPDTDSEFKLEKKLLDQIYASATEDAVARHGQSDLGIGIGLTVLSPKEFKLSNSYYEVSWADADEKYPMPYVFLGATIANWGWGMFGWSTRAGYSYRESLRSLTQKGGAASSRDFLRVHWASAMGRLEFSVMSSAVPWVRPVLFGGAGAQWIFQVGRLDGVNQSYVIPTYTAGAELVFWDQSAFKARWFSGARVGLSYLSAFASTQKFTAVGVDLGAAFSF